MSDEILQEFGIPVWDEITIKKRGLRELHFKVRVATSDQKSVESCFHEFQKPRKGFKILPDEEWVDFGASVGGFPCLVRALGGKLIYAVEPHAPAAALCRENLKRNGFDLDVPVVWEAAVVEDSYEGDTALLNVHPKPTQYWRNSLDLSWRGQTQVEVPVARFSELAQDRCVKMSVEGREIKIFQELTEPIPLKMAIEWHFDVNREIRVTREILDKLRGWYDHVLPVKLPDKETWDWWPTSIIIFAGGRK
jgi:FkbM family methyltransferase